MRSVVYSLHLVTFHFSNFLTFHRRDFLIRESECSDQEDHSWNHEGEDIDQGAEDFTPNEITA